MNYNINKGIGRTVEFKGLKAQYLFIFAGGLLGTLILVMILYMAGVNSYICLFLGAGWGWWYYFYSQDDVLGEMEQQARHEKKGLWADPNAIAPWEYRKLKK